MKGRCLICDTEDSWKNVDKYAHKEQGMHICTNCGFVTYERAMDKEALKNFYRSEKGEYRDAPTARHEFQQERKIHYHAAFLNDLFTQWQKEEKQPVVFESGSAYGRFLEWVRRCFPKAELHGTELTIPMRRVAKHMFGIELGEEFDDTKKYDFIASYKVAEHVPDVDKELRKFAECLRDDESRLYIGVPQWWQMQACFGIDDFNMSDYYHPNHINMWTRKLFETLLKKCGLEVISKNHIYYDSVYLCKRNDALMKEKPQYEDYKEIIKKMDAYKKADEYCENGELEKAIEANPCFPKLLMKHYETERAKLHAEGMDAIKKYINWAMQMCPESATIVAWAASIMLRYQQYEEAEALFAQALKMKPNNGSIIAALSNMYRENGKFEVSARYAQDCLHVSQELKNEQLTWLMYDLSRIPVEINNVKV